MAMCNCYSPYITGCLVKSGCVDNTEINDAINDCRSIGCTANECMGNNPMKCDQTKAAQCARDMQVGFFLLDVVVVVVVCHFTFWKEKLKNVMKHKIHPMHISHVCA